MQEELEDNQEDYCSLNHEDWCGILSTIKVKDNRKREATQINNIASARAAFLSDSNGSIRILRKNNSRIGAGVLCSKTLSHNKAPKNHSNQRHLVLCKKAGIPERKYISHIAEDCFGKRTNQKIIKDGLGGHMVSRYEAVKQYKKS